MPRVRELLPMREPADRAMVPLAYAYGLLLAYLLFHPRRRRHHRSPGDVGLVHREDSTTTDDGVALQLWVVPGGTNGVAVVGHGIGLTMSASLLHVKLLHDEGWTVVMFDHRNHAGSGRDRRIGSMADRFTRDVEAVVRFAQVQVPDVPTLVWGFSFSCFPSVYAVGRAACRIDAVLCDSGPTDELTPLFAGFLTSGALPVPRVLRGRRSLAALTTSSARTATRMLGATWPMPSSAGALSTTPMLFVCGRDDRIVAPELVGRLAARLPLASCETVGGGHLDALKSDPDGYRRVVHAFLRASDA